MDTSACQATQGWLGAWGPKGRLGQLEPQGLEGSRGSPDSRGPLVLLARTVSQGRGGSPALQDQLGSVRLAGRERWGLRAPQGKQDLMV